MEKEVRLIDANDLWTDIMMLPHNGDMISSDEVEQAIKEAPTVDAVEVKHGRMVEVTPDAECPWYKVWECSLCGNRGDVWYNYCPNCGAYMTDGDGNE